MYLREVPRKKVEQIVSIEELAGREVKAAIKLSADYRRRLEWQIKEQGRRHRELERKRKESPDVETPIPELGKSLTLAYRGYCASVASLSKEARESTQAIREALVHEDSDSLVTGLVTSLNKQLSALPDKQRLALLAQIERDRAHSGRTEH